jgi:serralysin
MRAGDGKPDIVTGTNGNGGPEVKAFSGVNVLSNPTPTKVDDFLAYDPAFSGGTRVALVDVNGDGKADIITGSGPGATALVRVFDGTTGLQLQQSSLDNSLPFDLAFSGGVFVGG